MNIALIGYGKMGKIIEELALSRGHTISFIADKEGFESHDLKSSDVAIEFTIPSASPANISKSAKAQTPIVVGTTGWYDRFDEIKDVVNSNNSGLFTATNFSIGVNLFFELNKKLASIMDGHGDYDVNMVEVHHTEKLDAPSGTAITLAEGIIDKLDRKNKWLSLNSWPEKQTEDLNLNIVSQRVDKVPGTHQITYTSAIDDIEIKHTAHNRRGFALGAVLAAEWMVGKQGIFSMNDMLGI
jgi:4-hydroxy-tetrahydrodipicolinate reductase